MARAPLGDDVLGDDPTVIELENLVAETTGKEAGLFVPSGTMGNQIALATHCRPGDSILLDEESHMLWYEGGAPSVVAGVVARAVPSAGGVMAADELDRRFFVRSHHTPGTSLICLENTHNRAGGAVIPLETMAAIREIADRRGVPIHLDGARVFNAAVALGVPVRALTGLVDSVCCCFSKGLCAPVGSALCGSIAFIAEARYWRKRLGGGMRQAGLLAACGIVALTKMVDRLVEDHVRARRLAEAIAELPNVSVDLAKVQTNMVLVDTAAPAEWWVERLAGRGVRVLAFGPNRLRLVLHHDVDDASLAHAIDVFVELASA